MVRSTRWMTSMTFAILATLGPLVAEADSSGMFAPERVGRGYLGGGVGGFWEESNSQLQNAKGQTGGFFGGGYRASRYIGLELDGLSYQQRVDTPPTVSSSVGRSRLTTSGVGGVVKFILPLTGSSFLPAAAWVRITLHCVRQETLSETTRKTTPMSAIRD